MKKLFLITTFLCITIISKSQIRDKSNAIWYFGDSVGIDFRGCEPQLLYDHHHWLHAESVSMSDENGNFLFYSDGTSVWNKNHQLMSNSKTPPNFIDYSSNGNTTVKQPGHNDIYYLFNIKPEFSYSVIDMSLDGGLGDIAFDSTIRFPYQSFEKKIAAVRHANGEDIWIATHEFGSDSFYCFLLTANGLDPNIVISKAGLLHDENSVIYSDGQLKFSPDGTKAASANTGLGNLEIFEFDNATGVFSNAIAINPVLPIENTFGTAFSSNGKMVYVGFDKRVYQFDLSSYSQQDIENSVQHISYSGINEPAYICIGNLQLAPDGKIYVAHETTGDYFKYLGVINLPDLSGMNSFYVDTGIYLGGNSSTIGLPNMLASSLLPVDFDVETGCIGEPATFKLSNDLSDYLSLKWNFGDTIGFIPSTSNEENPTYVYNDIGTYDVSLVVKDQCKTHIKRKKITIYDKPDFSLIIDSTICIGDSILLEPLFVSYHSNDTLYNWNTGNRSRYINVFDEGIYNLTIGPKQCLHTFETFIGFEECPFSIPNIITPNRDNYNETFSFNGIKSNSFELTVYNQWGKQVYKNNNYKEDWKGGDLNDGNYYYILKDLENNFTHKGWLQILR